MNKSIAFFTDQNQSHANQGAEIQQSTAVTRVSAPISVPRPTGEARLTAPGGVQPTSSFHSVSSIDSSAEMAKYFPDAQTPSLSPFRYDACRTSSFSLSIR